MLKAIENNPDIVVVTVMLIAAVAFSVFGVMTVLHEVLVLRKFTDSTYGTIIDLKCDSEELIRKAVKFKVRDTEYTVACVNSTSKRYKAGATVYLYYDPVHPECVRFDNLRTALMVGSGYMAVALTLLVACIASTSSW